MSNDPYNDKSVDAVLARIETKLDIVINRQEEFDSRLKVLETWRLLILGGSGVVSAGVAIVIKLMEK